MRLALRWMRRLALACVTSLFAFAAFASDVFEDSWIRVELPKGWVIEGEGGEYMLESDGTDLGSLLVLSPDPDRTLEELLADIEEQFLSTGIYSLDSVEERTLDGESVHYRRYRMTGGGEGDETSIVVNHQFSFWRGDAQVLLQVETGEKSASPDRLLSKVFSSLEIVEAPAPFLYEDLEGFDDEFPAVDDSGTVIDDDPTDETSVSDEDGETVVEGDEGNEGTEDESGFADGSDEEGTLDDDIGPEFDDIPAGTAPADSVARPGTVATPKR